jgi:hypothetical protein
MYNRVKIMNQFVAKVLCLLLLALVAAVPAVSDDGVEQGRAMIKAERENMIRAELHMTEIPI